MFTQTIDFLSKTYYLVDFVIFWAFVAVSLFALGVIIGAFVCISEQNRELKKMRERKTKNETACSFGSVVSPNSEEKVETEAETETIAQEETVENQDVVDETTEEPEEDQTEIVEEPNEIEEFAEEIKKETVESENNAEDIIEIEATDEIAESDEETEEVQEVEPEESQEREIAETADEEQELIEETIAEEKEETEQETEKVAEIFDEHENEPTEELEEPEEIEKTEEETENSVPEQVAEDDNGDEETESTDDSETVETVEVSSDFVERTENIETQIEENLTAQPIEKKDLHTEIKDGFVYFDAYSRSFISKLIQANAQVQGYYTQIKNALLSYRKVHDRLSWRGESFRLGRKLEALLSFRGRTLCMYVALNPEDYNKNIYHQRDYGDRKRYKDVPMMVKVRSDLGVKRAVALINILLADVSANKKFEWSDYTYQYLDDQTLLEDGLIKLIRMRRPVFLGENESQEEAIQRVLDELEQQPEIDVDEDLFEEGEESEEKIPEIEKTPEFEQNTEEKEETAPVEIADKHAEGEESAPEFVESESKAESRDEIIEHIEEIPEEVEEPKQKEKVEVVPEFEQKDEEKEENEFAFEPIDEIEESEPEVKTKKEQKSVVPEFEQKTEEEEKTSVFEKIEPIEIPEEKTKETKSGKDRVTVPSFEEKDGETTKKRKSDGFVPEELEELPEIKQEKSKESKSSASLEQKEKPVFEERTSTLPKGLYDDIPEEKKPKKEQKQEESKIEIPEGLTDEEKQKIAQDEELLKQLMEGELDEDEEHYDIVGTCTDTSNFTAFENKIYNASNIVKYYYSELKNTLLSYKKIKCKQSNAGDSFRQGNNLVARITFNGNKLRLHLALNPKDYNVNDYNHYSMINVNAYKEVPFTLEITGRRDLISAAKLIQDAMGSKFVVYLDNKREYFDYAAYYTKKED